MERLFILSIILLSSSCFTSISCQIIELPIELIYSKSTLIVEGKVEDVISRVNDQNGEIFSVNRIQVSKIFKGNTTDEFVEILTRGGTVGDETLSFTHMPVLTKGDRCILFLYKTNNGKFKIYAGVQGLFVLDPVFKNYGKSYFVESKNIYGYLDNRLKVLAGNAFVEPRNEINRKCLKIKVDTELSLDGNEFKFNIIAKAKQSEGNNFLKNFVFVSSYDTTIIGGNIVQNNLLEFELGSELNSYTLLAQDISENKFSLSIQLENSSQFSDGVLLNSVSYKDIFELEVVLPQISDDVSLEVNSDDILESTQYYVSETAVDYYDCISIISDLAVLSDSIKITSVSNSIVAAGVGQFAEDDFFTPGQLIIRGENFGVPYSNIYKPDTMVLGFSNAGPSGTLYCYPPKRDIISWNDTAIVVNVPAVDSSGNLRTYSGTGQVVVFNRNTLEIASSPIIKVNYAVNNFIDPFPDGRQSEPVKMTGVNDSSGYTIYLTNSIKTAIPGFLTPFEKALDEWRCKTGFNAVIKDSIAIDDISTACPVSFVDTLPNGVLTTLALTRKQLIDCGPGVLQNYLPRFQIFYNKFILSDTLVGAEEINWYSSASELPNSIDTFPNIDVQSVSLHELGHASLLLHTRDTLNIMYRNYNGTDRDIDFTTDQQGGTHAVNISAMEPHCEDVMVKYNCLTNSSNYSKREVKLKVFPNPTINSINLKIEDYSRALQVCIYDVSGRLLKKIEYDASIDNQLTININNLHSGLYFIQVNGDAGFSHRTRFIKK